MNPIDNYIEQRRKDNELAASTQKYIDEVWAKLMADRAAAKEVAK